MKDELFADLLASAEEMVRIEKGEETPEPEHVHTFSEIDVKAIREATGLRQQDFAVAVGVSYDLVKSWETKRRQPTGAPRKLLLLLQANPFIINQLKQSKNGRHLRLPFYLPFFCRALRPRYRHWQPGANGKPAPLAGAKLQHPVMVIHDTLHNCQP